MGCKAIYRAVEAGDAKVALAMFKGLGLFEPPAEGRAQDVVILRRAVVRNESDAKDSIR